MRHFRTLLAHELRSAALSGNTWAAGGLFLALMGGIHFFALVDASRAPNARTPVEATLCVQNAQRERESESQVGLAQVPACHLFDALESIRRGVAMHTQRAAGLRGSRGVQDGTHRLDALSPSCCGTHQQRCEQRARKTPPFGDGQYRPEQLMGRQEFGAHDLLASTAGATANTTLE